MKDDDRPTFLNRLTGTVTETSKEWALYDNQWSQTYYQYRDGKLYFVENDNKDQTYNEREVDIAGFLRQHGANSEHPYPQIVAFLKTLS